MLLFLFKQSILFDDFLAVVITASFAHMVRQYIFATFGAFDHTGHFKFGVIGPSLISAGAGNFFLRNCHLTYTSLG